MAENNQKVTVYETLEAALKAGDFYAINNTDKATNGPKGQVIIGFRNAQGDSTPVLFPPTWLPLDLTQYVSPDMIRTSNAIRDYIRKKMIILIDRASYEILCKHPNYKMEADRVAKLQGNQGGSLNGNAEVSISLSAPATMLVPENVGGEVAETVITRAIVDSTDTDLLIQRFDQALPGLTINDFRWMIQNAPQGSLAQMLAVDMESRLLKDGLTNITSVKESDAYRDFLASGQSSGPSLSFN